MTSDKKKELKKIVPKLRLIFPDFYGSVQFNLAVGKPVNVNLVEDCGNGITVKENVKLT